MYRKALLLPLPGALLTWSMLFASDAISASGIIFLFYYVLVIAKGRAWLAQLSLLSAGCCLIFAEEITSAFFAAIAILALASMVPGKAPRKTLDPEMISNATLNPYSTKGRSSGAL